MKLQLSLDMVDLNEALSCIDETIKSVDIIEVGTPLVLSCGVKAISLIKEKYPNKEVLADFKIMDAGYYEACISFEAGADIVTVLGVSSDRTISGVISAARKFQKKVMVDLIGMAEIEERMDSLEKLGVDYVCAHTGVDDQNGINNPFAQLAMLKRGLIITKLAVAGGLNIGNIDGLLRFSPDIVVVGRGITSTPDRVKSAADIKRKMTENNYD